MATACADARPAGLYSVAQLRAIEQAALSGLPPGTLMQRAGAAVARAALELLPDTFPAPILVLAGPGNNGGDALEAAAVLAADRHPVCVLLLADPRQLPDDARSAYARAAAAPVRFITPAELDGPWALAIDGLFGIGLARPLEGEYRRLAERLPAFGCPVLAIDIPSGLDADNGTIVGDVAIVADRTVTFIADKPGLHTGFGRDHAGKVEVCRLGIATGLYGAPRATLVAPPMFENSLPHRPHASHKGSYGDLTVLGGASGMGGAVLLAARMGAMAGAGRVYAAFAGPVPPFDPVHPELMCRDASAVSLGSGAAVAGPGLGMSRDACELVARALASELPLVLDADALNLMVVEPALQQKLVRRRAPTLLTPHPLEAARLMGVDAAQVQSNRLGVAEELAARFTAFVVLKGSGSIIAAPDGRLAINGSGNAALATAGSGDVLAGLCGALLAQHMQPWEAACAAAWLHGAAADLLLAEGVGPIGVTAGELIDPIRRCLNQVAVARTS